AAVWREVLGDGGIGVADHLFGLGGNPLNAPPTQAPRNEAFGGAVPLSPVFDPPEVGGAARRIHGLGLGQIAASRSPVRRPGAVGGGGGGVAVGRAGGGGRGCLRTEAGGWRGWPTRSARCWSAASAARRPRSPSARRRRRTSRPRCCSRRSSSGCCTSSTPA